VVNGKELFLQGVNYPPVSPYYADVTRADHEKRLRAYRDIGLNILRLNACGILESEDFYDLCDEMGIMVWQEMPLTSSGVENTPPDDPLAVAELEEMARSFVVRRAHHASLTLWGGGNEQVDKDLVPYDATHPTLRRLKAVFEAEDPTRRFVPCSPGGPRFSLSAKDIGKGVHHDVHGPWKPEAGIEEWKALWEQADALFCSELGSPGASPVDLIERYRGELDPLPVSLANPLWRNPISWWLEAARFLEETGHAPGTLSEYVSWSQDRQARALEIAVSACKRRFPRCGGVILWMGHDCFPCPTNTSILDFHGNPKPAALALQPVLRGEGPA
jgi:beta-mannosidase